MEHYVAWTQIVGLIYSEKLNCDYFVERCGNEEDNKREWPLFVFFFLRKSNDMNNDSVLMVAQTIYSMLELVHHGLFHRLISLELWVWSYLVSYDNDSSWTFVLVFSLILTLNAE